MLDTATIERLRARGFEHQHTGGNCTAYCKVWADESESYMTADDDATAPESLEDRIAVTRWKDGTEIGRGYLGSLSRWLEITMDTFTRSYIKTARWSSTADDGTPLDSAEHAARTIAPETLALMERECATFQHHNRHLYDDAERAGHDFWLTRNGHGAGFWDGYYPSSEAKRLTDKSKLYGTFDLYVGDDGQIHGA
jgi:hypothetical protein